LGEKWKGDERNGLHGDGIFGVAVYVPAGIVLGVRENRAGTGDVLFWSYGVDLIFGFVALGGDGEKANAVNRGARRAQAGNGEAGVVPGKVDSIENKKQEGESRSGSQNQAGAGRRAIRL
jgi:hypothetical protein